MLKAFSSHYLGKESINGFSGLITEDNFFLVLEAKEGLAKTDGLNIIKQIKENVSNSKINNLGDYEKIITEEITRMSLPSNFSLASGFINKDILYLKTIGQGIIFIRRNRQFAKIINANNTASGYIKPDDFYIFTSESFIEAYGGDFELKSAIDNKTSHDVVSVIDPQFRNYDDTGLAAIFISTTDYEAPTMIEAQTYDPKSGLTNQLKTKVSSITGNIKNYSMRFGRKKTLTVIAMILIAITFIWSVIFGHQRRLVREANNKLTVASEVINQKLNEAENVSFLNMSRALILVDEAKQELNKLKKEIGDKKADSIADIESLIKDKENLITKKEEKKYDEFYDLTVEDSKAAGSKLALDKDNLSILDEKNKAVYILSLERKSFTKRNSSELGSAGLVSIYEDKIYFLKQNGSIFEISTDNKIKEVIKLDKDWKNIVDMSIYNGNIYLLDSGTGDIYKYLVTDNGYSGKTAYFKSGSSNSLTDANSMAIDSSVYVGLTDYIDKFTGGIQDKFVTDFPEEDITITKIFTNKDLNKIYVWNKKLGVIYVINKTGSYERQIKSDILNKSSDMVVYDESAFSLYNSKIYKIDMK